QRYSRPAQNGDRIVFCQRTPRSIPKFMRDCSICTDSKPLPEFPICSVSKLCTHPPEACLECITTSIKTDFTNKRWDQIHCPECHAPMEYQEVELYADKDTFAKYSTIAFRSAVGKSPDFIWCPANCGSGQVHETGDDRPIVCCVQCKHKFCFRHQVAWQKSLSCEEYDRFLEDPETFRSCVDLDNEAAENMAQAELSVRQEQEERDRIFALSLLEAEQAEEARRQAERSRFERERREAAERARTEAARETERKRLNQTKADAARKKMEEDASQATVQKTTKPCPGCGWAIEKNEGCAHMTCAKCEFEFCYDCGASHRDILRHGNALHKITCPWHMDNLPVALAS
ncbi:uncharacterized protein BCR38DRAFT_355178, partial [Pseudomassariella vexata]